MSFILNHFFKTIFTDFKINDIKLVHLLVVWWLVNLQDARCNNKDDVVIMLVLLDQPLDTVCYNLFFSYLSDW